MIALGCLIGAVANFWIFGLGGNWINFGVAVGCSVAAVLAGIAEAS